MKLSIIKRFFQRPLSKINTNIRLNTKIMTPVQILEQEKVYHTQMINANKAGRRDSELEYKHKRDALRLVLGIYE